MSDKKTKFAKGGVLPEGKQYIVNESGTHTFWLPKDGKESVFVAVDPRYIDNADVKRRAGVFALWLGYEARSNPELEAVRQVFLAVEADIASGRMVQGEQASYLYGVIEGHAKAWAYLEEYQADMKLYLSEYLWAVRDGDNG